MDTRVVPGIWALSSRTRAAAVAAGGSGRGRWLAIAHAMRDWAGRRPAAWALLYGSPVPGYAAPGERTTPAGTKVLFRLATVVADALVAGELGAGAVPPAGVPDGVAQDLLAAARSLGVEGEPAVVAATILGWTSVVATISSEVFGQLGADTFAEPGTWAGLAFAVSADVVGLRDDARPA